MKNISVTTSAHPQHKDIMVLGVKGFIDTNTAPEFEKVFQSVLGEKKFNLVVDLTEADYISSAGWGIFVGELKRIRNQKGNLFLVSMNPEVEDAYQMLELHTIIKAFPSVDHAIKHGFKKNGGLILPDKNPTPAVSPKVEVSASIVKVTSQAPKAAARVPSGRVPARFEKAPVPATATMAATQAADFRIPTAKAADRAAMIEEVAVPVPAKNAQAVVSGNGHPKKGWIERLLLPWNWF